MKITVRDSFDTEHYFDGDFWLEPLGYSGVAVKKDVNSINSAWAVFPSIEWAMTEE